MKLNRRQSLTIAGTWWAAGMGIAGAAQAQGQGTAPGFQDPTLAPAPQPVSLLLAEQPLVNVEWDGDSGRAKLVGVLRDGPRGLVEVTDGIGRRRRVQWAEIEVIQPVTIPSEGLPEGSFRVGVSGEPGQGFQQRIQVGGYNSNGGAGAGGGLGGPAGEAQQGWRLLRLPEGTITLEGAPYGRVQVPIQRLYSYQLAPLRGVVQVFPPGEIRVELQRGTVVSVQFPTVVYLRRDLPRGTILLTLEDGQQFSGRELALPKVDIPVLDALDEKAPPTIVPLTRVLQLQRTPPRGSR